MDTSGGASWAGAAAMGSCVKQCLKGEPSGTELCWGCAGRAAARGKPMWDQLEKAGIPWEGPTWSSDQVTMEEWHYRVAAAPTPCSPDLRN